MAAADSNGMAVADEFVITVLDPALVSNIRQTSHGRDGLADVDAAQGFDTGTHPGGYELTGVELRLTTAAALTAVPRVRLVAGSPQAAGGVTLTGPDALPTDTTGTYVFTAPAGTKLKPSTTYSVVMESVGNTSSGVDWLHTRSNSEDATPATGWSITDESQSRARQSTGSFSADAADKYLLRVRGTPIANPVRVTFGAASYTATEGGTDAAVTVTLSRAPGAAVEIPLTVTRLGSATAADYMVTPATVPFGATEQSQTVRVVATDDLADDDNESLTLGLDLPAGYAPGTPATTTVSLVDNDTANTVPTAAPGTVTTAADTAYTFRAADFNFMDPDNDPLSSVTIVTLPALGSLHLNNVNVSANAVVPATALAAGQLTYTPPAGQSGTNFTSFTFTVNDGTADSTNTQTMTINVSSGGGSRGGGGPVTPAEDPDPIGGGGGGGGGSGIPAEAPDLIGLLENPGAAAFQSGISLISGWVCEGAEVVIELGHLGRQAAAYGTERPDTAGECGDTDNGFGLLFNWNRLGDGEAPRGPTRAGVSGVGYLENPGPNSFQSGIGVISGWVCEGAEVVIELGHLGRQVAASGTERLDTLEVCGDTDNGFGLLFNWNRLGDGEHAVVASVDGVELGRATVRVTTLGEEFVRGVEGECTVEDFPGLGETVTLEWQQTSQNFVITDIE